MPRNNKPVEKAKNFKGTLKQLLSYVKPYYGRIIFSLVLMVISTCLCIYGPKLSGNATTLLSEGIVLKYQGKGGIDFDGLWKIVFSLIVLYATSAAIDYFVNYINVGVAVDVTYRLRKDISEKLDKLPLKYFDGKTHGDILSRVTKKQLLKLLRLEK